MKAWKRELYHHGILGQKWGVRNGPPYPLGSGDHSASEKKAGWKKSLKSEVKRKAKRALAIGKAEYKLAATYQMSSMFGMQLSSPAISQYAKIAKDLHEELSATAKHRKVPAAKVKTPLKVLSKPNEPSELHQNPDSPVAKFFAKFNPALANNIKNCRDYTIKNKSGQKVGEFFTEFKNNGDEININWMGVREKHGGKGHAQSAMRLAIDDARKQGVKYVTLEVPTESPNARHIYEKLGFKETGKGLFTDDDDIWGGLTEMRLDL